MNPHDGGAPAIRALDLVAGYGQRRILNGVSLEVAPGEMLAIVGPNGAGKSTLLRVLCAALAPWRGRVEVNGRALDQFDRRELARMMASVGQENAAAFTFTVLEVVLMGRAPHLGRFHFESRRDLAAAYAALARFDLLDLAARPIEELSSGERKRAFLAQAIARNPEIVLLDEPTAFLDLRHVAEIFGRFRELCRSDKLAVIATLHDLNAATTYADRILLLKDGMTVACGVPDAVITADNLRRVYETEIYVGRNPITGAVMVMPAAAPARS